VKEHALEMLKEAHNFEQIGRTRVADCAEHAHEAFRRNVRCLGEAREPYRSVDVIVQDCLASVISPDSMASRPSRRSSLRNLASRCTRWDPVGSCLNMIKYVFMFKRPGRGGG
jgi:hypothetical protein